MPRVTIGPGPLPSTQPRETPTTPSTPAAPGVSTGWAPQAPGAPTAPGATGFGPTSGDGGMVRNGGQRLAVPDPIVLRSDAEGRGYTAHASIPIALIDTAPLTADQFTAQLSGAALLPPWGPDTSARAEVRVSGGRIEIDAPVGVAGAFSVRPPIVFLKLLNGQDVSVTLVNPRVGRDDSALMRAQTERSITAIKTALSYDEQNVVTASTPDVLAQAKAVKAQHEADLARLEAQLAAVNSGAGTTEFKATTYPPP